MSFTMNRPHRRKIFTERDLARALRAAHRAGGVARIEISSDDGKITLLLGEPPAGNGAANPLDQWIANRADQTEGH
jgi:hypothetical protein